MWKEDDPGNNRSVGHVRVYLYSTYQYFSNWIGEAYLDVNGGRVQYKYERFYMSGTNSSIEVLQWDGYIGHNSAGEASFYAYAYFNIPNGASYTPRGLWADASIGLQNYDRSAKTPYYDNITRTSATNIYVTYARTGSYNGPTTYVLERATNAAMTENYITFGEGNQTVDANTAYYYRMYAYGDEGSAKYSGVYGPYWGQPTPPQSPSASTNVNTSGAVNVWWTAPSNTQSGIDYYHIYRNGVSGVGTYVGQWNSGTPPTSSAPFYDNGAIPRSSNTYYIYAHTPQYWSNVSTVSNSALAASVPSAPGTPTVSLKVGRTLTINSTRGSNGYGNTVSEYRIQLSTDGGTTWKGWNNTTKAFTANNTYNVLDSSGDFTYNLLTPALTYQWRVYGVNTVVTAGATPEYSTLSAPTFVGAGGKRWTGTTWEPTVVSKRWSGTEWVDFTTAKRWDGSAWVDLT